MKKKSLLLVAVIPILGIVCLVVFYGRIHKNGGPDGPNNGEESTPDLLGSRLSVEGFAVEGQALKKLQQVYSRYAVGDDLKTSDIVEVMELFEDAEADSDICFGKVLDVDGKGDPDLVVKRYWTGSGNIFDLLLFLKNEAGFTAFEFSGGERGLVFCREKGNGRSSISIDDYVKDLDENGMREIILPGCVRDRGADTAANWPTIYKLEGNGYVVADASFPDFYRNKVLPLYEAELNSEKATASKEYTKDCKAIISQIHGIVRNPR